MTDFRESHAPDVSNETEHAGDVRRDNAASVATDATRYISVLPAAGRRIDRPAQVNAINGPESTLNIITGVSSRRARRRTNAIRRHA